MANQEAISKVDWSKVPTERQEEERAIRSQTETLVMKVEVIADEIDDLEESPGELTPAAIAESLGELSCCLRELTRLFRGHLAAVDLDDQAKAIGVSGGGLVRSPDGDC
jgi:hypothetical protein